MIRLVELRDADARPALPQIVDIANRHQALTAALAAHLSPEHAALLAVPVRGGNGTTWFAPGNAKRGFAELPVPNREKLLHAARVILSDIRRLAESNAAPAVTAAWPALRAIPGYDHLFAVDGRPVLAGWGHAPLTGGAGPLADLDDGIAWRPPPGSPWRVYAVTLAGLAALALIGGLLLAPLVLPMLANGAVCRVPLQQLALLREQAREADRTHMLQAALAQVEESAGEHALHCPIRREVMAPPTPERAKVCVGDWPIGKWIRITATPQGLAPEATTLNADPAVTVPDWKSRTTRFTPCGAFHQLESIASRPRRLPDGRSAVLNSINADGDENAHLCYEYWDAYRREGQGWVRDAVQLLAVVLRTPAGTAVAGAPTAFCAPPSPVRH